VPPGSTGVSFQPTYSSSTNRFTAIPGASVSYDSDGNLLADGSHTYSWDSDGRPHVIDTMTYTYDAMDRVVEQAVGSTYTQTMYGPTGKLALFNGQTLVKAFVPLPGGATAVYLPGQLPAYYRHNDWLGSARLSTTPSRTKYYDVAYGPFGESYNGSGTQDLNFAGMNQDTVTGLYDATFREYHPVQGRWPSPDPAGFGAVDMSNPQSWNRYAYVGNNPLSAVDPLGLSARPCTDSCEPQELIPPGFSIDTEGCANDGSNFPCEDWWFPLVSYGSYTNSLMASNIFEGENSVNLPVPSLFQTIWSDVLGLPSLDQSNCMPICDAQTANNGFTLGVRAPGQTWTQCMSANSGNYSINGVLPSSWQNGATSVLAGNDVSSILFGNSSEGSAGLLAWEGGSNSFEAGVGSVMTAGRRTASIMDLNLAGTTGPAPMILGKTGAEQAAGWLSGVAEIKMAIDVGLTGAEAIGCAIHR